MMKMSEKSKSTLYSYRTMINLIMITLLAGAFVIGLGWDLGLKCLILLGVGSVVLSIMIFIVLLICVYYDMELNE